METYLRVAQSGQSAGFGTQRIFAGSNPATETIFKGELMNFVYGEQMDLNEEIDINRVFYLEIEEGVRDWVFRFRNHGINTTCSCHHEGFIQCVTVDPTEEIRQIKTIFLNYGIAKFEVEFKYEGLYFSHIEIRSPVFKKVVPAES